MKQVAEGYLVEHNVTAQQYKVVEVMCVIVAGQHGVRVTIENDEGSLIMPIPAFWQDFDVLGKFNGVSSDKLADVYPCGTPYNVMSAALAANELHFADVLEIPRHSEMIGTPVKKVLGMITNHSYESFGDFDPDTLRYLDAYFRWMEQWAEDHRLTKLAEEIGRYLTGIRDELIMVYTQEPTDVEWEHEHSKNLH